ncbi:MAG TPA: hypothetical protein VFA81_07425 [Burkholderiales bacterium]|nr:hypothetical protein [Burkholderiales bacterium]
MIIDEFEQHLVATGHAVGSADAGGNTYVIIKAVPISAGAHAGKTCDVGIMRSTANPWVPQAAVHVRPHLVAMGQASSQASPLGADWQYLSRRFDKTPTAKAFLAHILTVLGEL